MYPTGAIASAPDSRDSDFHKSDTYAGAVPTAVRDYDFRHLHRWRVQGGPSCVAYSLVAKVQALATAQAKALPDLCAELNWWGARNYANPPGTAVMGSSCRLNIKYARDRGLKAEHAFPDQPENHNRVPPFGALETQPVVRVVKYHRIHGENDADTLRDGILTAFALLDEGGQCSFPGAVMDVGSGYANVPDGETWDGTMGDLWGGHDQAIGLYRAKDDCVGILSSWPKNPGDTQDTENAIGVDGGRVYWMPIPLLAARGSEFWVVDQLEYVQ